MAVPFTWKVVPLQHLNTPQYSRTQPTTTAVLSMKKAAARCLLAIPLLPAMFRRIRRKRMVITFLTASMCSLTQVQTLISILHSTTL